MSIFKDGLIRQGASGSTAVATYTIDQSIRFNRNDNAYLSKTFSGAGDRKTYTFSWWL